MNALFDTPIAEGAETFRPKGHDIVFDHVEFAYDKEAVLHDVSFTAKEGEITALVGPSGSGKSTCARLAARLWDITGGTIKAVSYTHLDVYKRQIPECISNLLLPVAVFVYLVCIDWRMALAMLVTLPFVLIAFAMMMKNFNKLYADYMEDVYKRQL